MPSTSPMPRVRSFSLPANRLCAIKAPYIGFRDPKDLDWICSGFNTDAYGPGMLRVDIHYRFEPITETGDSPFNTHPDIPVDWFPIPDPRSDYAAGFQYWFDHFVETDRKLRVRNRIICWIIAIAIWGAIIGTMLYYS